ncbi:sensor histidine kinase [Nonomuraea roseoviolacea]|uniref:histidine kinase n=1 Tax=Nonomuraea roseoviolacea subsp. carminata TaxID=160689 RepID=A0ABT1K0W7_9ACTN|nr:histidine kinase [Nonomuraea roseoviolacea]MCP2347242.1 signal transduction histidine kinase [Nonomuraea roseoviolacea subsp. carminata]
MLVRTALEALAQRPIPFLRSAWPWRSLAYLLAGAVPGLPVLGVVAAVAVTSSPAVLVAGVAVAALLTPVAGRYERWRLRLVDGVPLPDTPPEPGGDTGEPPRRGREVRVAALGGLALLVLWWIDLVMAASGAAGPVLLILSPVVQPEAEPVAAVAASAAGVLLVPVAAYTLTAWAGARGAMTRAILAPQAAELAEVLRSRARLVDAFETERRRIERDLHDGAQQRLVALTMTLGMARLDLPDDSPAARAVERAHGEAKQALAELRALVRGVHSQVLTDRGLPAAVRDVAGRSPVPVAVDLALDERLPAAVEVTAYYVVTEALANVARHSGASAARVTGGAADGALVLEIHDDGRGGADPARGTGLTGLADRLAVVGGRLSLSSPAGGPTRMRVEIPCAS